MNARRLVTTWGGDLNDYACRNWAGLLSNYYFERWNCYFSYLIALANDRAEYNHSMLQESIKIIQDQWPEKNGLESLVQTKDLTTVCKTINAMFREKLNNIKTSN